MKNYFLLFSVFCVLFVPTFFAPLLGLKETTIYGYTPMMLYVLWEIFAQEQKIRVTKHNKYTVYLLALSLVIYLIKLFIGQDYLKTVLCFLIIPMLMSLAFDRLRVKEQRFLQFAVLAFFFVECGMSFYERATHTFVLPVEWEVSEYYSPQDWEFRAQAMLGHPLANAMAITTLAAFVLISEYSFRLKLICYFFGIVSLFCFNARGATLVYTFVLTPYFIYSIYKSDIKRKRLIFFVFGLAGIFLVYQLFNTSLGGRILNQEELVDGSAKTRLDSWQFYKFVSFKSLLLGSPDNHNFVMQKLHAGGVENGFAAMVLKYGLLITLVMLPLLFMFQYSKLSISCSKLDRVVLLISFFSLGMMNQNLCYHIQWVVWILSYYSFCKVPIRERRHRRGGGNSLFISFLRASDKSIERS